MSLSDCVLIQQSTKGHAYLLNLTVKDHADYCLTHEIDYWPVFGDVVKGRHAFWNKLALILKAVEAGYERIVWLDSDCYIADPSKDLREACPVDGIGATWHAQEWTEAPGLYDHHNAGALYLGAGTACKRFLKCWWNADDEDHPWHDQHAFNRGAQEAYRALWRAEPPIVTLGHEWNSTPFFSHAKPMVAAWHGCFPDLERRMELMQAFIAENKLKRLVDGASLEEARQKAEFCMGVGNWAVAERFYERLFVLGEEGAPFWAEYARSCSKQQKWHDAINYYDAAINLDPTNGKLWFNLASCYDYLGDHEANGEALAEAQKHSPNMPGLMHNSTLWQLRDGQWSEGFDGLKWQFVMTERVMRYPGPEWDGYTCDRLLVWSEQGLGDTLMLARYVPNLHRANKVILEVHAPLAELLKAQCWPGVEVVAKPADQSIPYAFDEHVGMFSLPHLFGATVENTSGEAYLKAPADRVEKWQKRFFIDAFNKSADFNCVEPRVKRIGFSWAGSAQHGNNANRNMQASHFDDLVKTPGTCWYCLQRDMQIDDETRKDTPEVVAWIGDEFADMADTAGALANLDLVITIDSAIAHLCGALGVKCWLLLSKSSDWRWLLSRRDSPWYKSVRLYRQETLGDWAGVIAKVDADLRELLNP